MGNHTCDGLEWEKINIETNKFTPLFDMFKRKELLVMNIRYCPYCGEKLG